MNDVITGLLPKGDASWVPSLSKKETIEAYFKMEKERFEIMTKLYTSGEQDQSKIQ